MIVEMCDVLITWSSYYTRAIKKQDLLGSYKHHWHRHVEASQHFTRSWHKLQKIHAKWTSVC